MDGKKEGALRDVSSIFNLSQWMERYHLRKLKTEGGRRFRGKEPRILTGS